VVKSGTEESLSHNIAHTDMYIASCPGMVFHACE
jgi:hypothetical protein